jgi:hypothetical protein
MILLVKCWWIGGWGKQASGRGDDKAEPADPDQKFEIQNSHPSKIIGSVDQVSRIGGEGGLGFLPSDPMS